MKLSGLMNRRSILYITSKPQRHVSVDHRIVINYYQIIYSLPKLLSCEISSQKELRNVYSHRNSGRLSGVFKYSKMLMM